MNNGYDNGGSKKNLRKLLYILGSIVTILTLYEFLSNNHSIQDVISDLWNNNSVGCNGWNLASDFRTYPNHENPNRDSCGNSDVWYFYESTNLDHNFASYVLLQSFMPDAFAIPKYQQWQGSHKWPNEPNIYFPFIGINTNNETKMIVTAMHPAKSIAVHPYDSQNLIIIGWKSPVTKLISISGFVRDLDSFHGGDGILWFIDKGDYTLASGSYVDGGQQPFLDGNGGNNLENVSVQKGDFLYFIVHPNINDLYDTTQIDIQINIVVP